MDQLRPDLWQTSVYSEGGVNNCGFLLIRPDEGNVLFYNTTNVDDLDKIAELGGVGYHVLSHRHECDTVQNAVKARFGARLCCDAAEAAEIGKVSPVDIELTPGDARLGSVEVLATPGHTAGGVSCRYRSPGGEVYLVTGDTMIPVAGNWVAQFVPSHGGAADVLIHSLLRLGELTPDLILASSTVGGHGAVAVEHEEWIHAVETTASRPPIQEG